MSKNLLSNIALFLEVVETKSFTKAAERLEMPASTLSRRISALESAIGFRLLNRNTRKVEVTGEGASYFQRCKPLFEEASLAHEEISSTIQSVTGVLRVTCAPDLANFYFPAVLAKFAEENPQVSVELSLNASIQDLFSNKLDLAIRLGNMEDSTLVARPLATLNRAIYASPEFLKKHESNLSSPQDLAAMPCIRNSPSEAASTWSLSRTGSSGEETQEVAVSGRLVAGGPILGCELAIRGWGIVLLHEHVAESHLRTGRLVRVLPEWQPSGIPVQAVTTSRLMPARVRRFVEHLKPALCK